MKPYLTVILLFLSNTAFAFYNYDNCFPGKERISSPCHKYELIWREPKDRNDSHHLFYQIKNKGESYELLTFNRYVCVHWSPDETYFTISDYMGSNVADVYIFKSDNTSERLDIMDLLPAEVSDLFKGVSYGYLGTVSWGKDGLIVRAFGDREDDPKGFDINLRCTVEKGKWKCTKLAASKPPKRDAAKSRHTP